MKSTIFTIFTVLLLLIACGKVDKLPESVAKIETPKEIYNYLTVKSILGAVVVKNQNAEESPAAIGQKLEQNQTIITAKKELAELTVSQFAYMKIMEQTELSISKVLEQINNKCELVISKGQMIVVKNKLSKDSLLKINTKTMVVAVRGTVVKINADEKKSRLTVISGEVYVTPAGDLSDAEAEKLTVKVEPMQSLVIEDKHVQEIRTKLDKNEDATGVLNKPERISETDLKDVKAALETSDKTSFENDNAETIENLNLVIADINRQSDVFSKERAAKAAKTQSTEVAEEPAEKVDNNKNNPNTVPTM